MAEQIEPVFRITAYLTLCWKGMRVSLKIHALPSCCFEVATSDDCSQSPSFTIITKHWLLMFSMAMAGGN